MSIWLRKRLTYLFGGSVALIAVGMGAVRIKAQNEKAPSAEEAAIRFSRLLRSTESPEDYNDGALKWSLLSSKDWSLLGSTGLDPLLRKLQENSKKPQFEVTSKAEENGATVVNVAPNNKPVSLPVVVVQQDGGYVVDLLATYAKRLNLNEFAMRTQIFQETGVLLPGDKPLNLPASYVQQRVCETNMKEIGLATMQYSQDYDEKLPMAENWTLGLDPYTRKKSIFSCPSTPGGKGGYAYNSRLDKVNLGDLKSPERTVLFYETSQVIPQPVGSGTDLIYRHKPYDGAQAGANFCFADGSARFLYKSTPTPSFRLNPPQPKAKKQ